MNIYYVVSLWEYQGDIVDSAKVFLSVESAEAYKAELEAEEGYNFDSVEIRHMFANA
jgi:hypothetical protein